MEPRFARENGGLAPHGATLYLGRGTTRSPSTINALVPSSRQTPAQGVRAVGPACSDGTGYGPGVRAQGKSRKLTVARPSSVAPARIARTAR